MKAKSIDELPLPKINPKLPDAVKIKAQLIFYKHLMRVSAWSLRGMHGLYVEQEGRTEKDDLHDRDVWKDPLFQIRYQVLLKLSGVGSFYRWQAYLQEFVFYNTVGFHYLPKANDPMLNTGYSIREDTDIIGSYVEVRLYTQQTDKSWRTIQRKANTKLRNYEQKWAWSGADPELIVQVANMHRINPKLTSSDVAGQIMDKFPKLAKKNNGYTDSDIKKIIANAKKLGF